MPEVIDKLLKNLEKKKNEQLVVLTIELCPITSARKKKKEKTF